MKEKTKKEHKPIQTNALRRWADRITAMLLGRTREEKKETEEERLLRIAREMGEEKDER
jgi:hypothetical protein